MTDKINVPDIVICDLENFIRINKRPYGDIAHAMKPIAVSVYGSILSIPITIVTNTANPQIKNEAFFMY